MLCVLQGSAGQKIRGHGYLLVYMKTAKKSNPQPFFSPKSRKWRKKSIARQHLHVPRSCRRRLAILQQLSLKQDDLEWPPLLPGCGTQHPLRALGGTRVLLAAAPTTPPCFRRWRRSSSLLAMFSGKIIFNFAFAERSAAMKAPLGLSLLRYASQTRTCRGGLLHLAYARPFCRLKAPLGLSLLRCAAQTRTFENTSLSAVCKKKTRETLAKRERAGQCQPS